MRALETLRLLDELRVWGVIVVEKRRSKTFQAEAALTKPDNKPDRLKTRCLVGHIPEDAYWQLKQIAVDQRVDMQTIVFQMINALFEKYGKPTFPEMSYKSEKTKQTKPKSKEPAPC